jgi:hypothetical protein
MITLDRNNSVRRAAWKLVHVEHGSATMRRNRPVRLSITHNFSHPDLDSDCNVHEVGETTPYKEVAGRRMADLNENRNRPTSGAGPSIGTISSLRSSPVDRDGGDRVGLIFCDGNRGSASMR